MRKEILDRIKADAQFPFSKRDRPYQGISGVVGIRDLDHRLSIMNLPDKFEGKTVLDLGCNLGIFCIEAKKRRAKRVVGMDVQAKTIDVARDCAAESGLDVEYYVVDIGKGIEEISRIIGTERFDYIFALSIYKHVGRKKLFPIIKDYCHDSCWIEFHNKDDKKKKNKELVEYFTKSRIQFLGYTLDRGQRPNFKICF